jgi:hypothetical protein
MLNRLDQNHIKVTAAASEAPEKVIERIQEIANLVNTPEEGFKRKLDDINKKLKG